MTLPIRTFFALYKEGNKLQAKEYREQLRIALSPKMDLKYFDLMSDFYSKIMDQTEFKVPEKPPRPGLDLASPEAKNAIIDMTSRIKRGLGYGR